MKKLLFGLAGAVAFTYVYLLISAVDNYQLSKHKDHVIDSLQGIKNDQVLRCMDSSTMEALHHLDSNANEIMKKAAISHKLQLQIDSALGVLERQQTYLKKLQQVDDYRVDYRRWEDSMNNATLHRFFLDNKFDTIQIK